MRRVVYTVLVDGFDYLVPPVHAEAGLDYVVYGDPGLNPVGPWQYRPLVSHQRNPRMTSRWHKLHPHLLFPEHDESLYIDANVLVRERITTLFEEVLRTAPLALFGHPDRNCPYEEAEIIKRFRYDDDAIVDAQMAFYRAQKFPEHAGLHYGGILFRRHRDPAMIAMLEDWWRHLKLFSHRDQLSLGFMLRRHGLVAANIPGDPRRNRWFMIGAHRRFRVDLAGDSVASGVDEIDWLRSAFIAACDRLPKPPEHHLSRAKHSLMRTLKGPVRLAKFALRRLLWRRRIARIGRAGRVEAS